MDATQEFIALGVSNLVGSFFHSMPVAASFGRSAVNSASSVKTTLVRQNKQTVLNKEKIDWVKVRLLPAAWTGVTKFRAAFLTQQNFVISPAHFSGRNRDRRRRPLVADVPDAVRRLHSSHDARLGHHLRGHLQHRVPRRHTHLEVKE